ncbi:MAG TPA: PspC domain-containing protein [Candidatus Dormibacteraeota bacterium]|nr:PspC domain-containing protein [Candidatus Dormibacteraeota bacterium]
MHERLYRSRTDRMLFGVAGGMADWLDLDPSVVRLVWALLIVAGGVGLVLYIIAAIVVPEEPLGLPAAPVSGSGTPDTAAGPAAAPAGTDQARWDARQARRAGRRARRGNGGIVVGTVLIFAGAWFLLQRFIPALDSSYVFPGILIIVGIALVIGAMGRPGDSGAP